MVENDGLRYAKLALNHGSVRSRLSFGTLIPDPATRTRDQGGASGGISPARRFGTTEMKRGRRNVREVFRRGVRAEGGFVATAGIIIIAPNAQTRSEASLKDSNSTTSISTSSPLCLQAETSKTEDATAM